METRKERLVRQMYNAWEFIRFWGTFVLMLAGCVAVSYLISKTGCP